MASELGTPVTELANLAEAAGALNSARKAITALQEADLEPTGFVMSPADWEAVETAAQETFAANPCLSPTNAMTRRLFGVPVVVSTGMGDGTALLGDFRTGCVLYIREEARVDWSENVYDPTFDSNTGATDFERNLIRFRAEMRAKLAVTRPAGFVTVATAS